MLQPICPGYSQAFKEAIYFSKCECTVIYKLSSKSFSTLLRPLTYLIFLLQKYEIESCTFQAKEKADPFHNFSCNTFYNCLHFYEKEGTILSAKNDEMYVLHRLVGFGGLVCFLSCSFLFPLKIYQKQFHVLFNAVEYKQC